MPTAIGTVYSLFWGNPHTRDHAPQGVLLWTVSIVDPGLDHHEAVRWAQDACPDWRPGDGYALGVQLPVRPIRRFSAAAKGRIRRSRLRKRLEAKLPLFADQLYEQALADRPGYFAGEDIEHHPPDVASDARDDPAP